MERINVSQLLHNAGELLSRAGEGESFEITRHGEPLALLGPLPEADDPMSVSLSVDSFSAVRGA